jgi:hypothetical protein
VLALIRSWTFVWVPPVVACGWLVRLIEENSAVVWDRRRRGPRRMNHAVTRRFGVSCGGVGRVWCRVAGGWFVRASRGGPGEWRIFAMTARTQARCSVRWRYAFLGAWSAGDLPGCGNRRGLDRL